MKKIGLILILIILLPIAFLIFNELDKLSENELVLQRIYNNQLQAILFSVNQYSEDVIRKTVNNIVDDIEPISNDAEKNQKIYSILNEGKKFTFLFIADSLNSKELKFYFRQSQDISNLDSLNKYFRKVLTDNDSLIKKIFSYRNQGYRKIDPLSVSNSGEQELLIFAGSETHPKRIYGIGIDPREFIAQILSSRLQEVAKGEFVISVINSKTGFNFNSTKDYEIRPIEAQKALWIFPDYNLGISLIGQSVSDLVKARATNNLIIIGILLAILIAAVWFVYRSVKNELELAKAKADFVSNVSHELRTPLALISMFAETLEMNRVKTEEKKKEYYSIISHESNRLSKIVNSILNFSKMEAGMRKFIFAEEDLNDLMVQIYQNYSYHLYNKGFDFDFEPGIDVPKVKVDREALSEAIVNLIDNAVKYSGETKYIKIAVTKENEYAVIEVEDKGIGIAEEYQKKIFDKFFRVSTGLVHSTKGTGLGLSLVKQIMDAHNGKIKLKSKLGSGSSFKLYFPIIYQISDGVKND
jgi:two-component system phosphate regulon sensor histidine kinase PhoR